MVPWLVARLPGADRYTPGQLPPPWLSAAEAEVYRHFAFPRRLTKWLAGRWAAKVLVARELASHGGEQVEARRITLANEPSGAPYLQLDGERLPWGVSLSHRSDLGLCALVTEPGLHLGADLERVEPRDMALVRQFFTAAEARQVADAGPDEHQVVTRIWSVKEAAMKALRVGLRVNTCAIEVGPDEGQSTGEWHKVRVSIARPVAETAGRDPNSAEAFWRTDGEYVVSAVILRR